MKQLTTLLLLLCSVCAMAQDVIVKKDGSTVVCRVEKVTDTEVTYKKWTDLKGSSYVMDKTLVSSINYETGKKEALAEADNLFKPHNQNDGVGTTNIAALRRLDLIENDPYKKVRQLKRIGWIGGGTCAGAGALLAVLGGLGVADDDEGVVWGMVAPGIILAGGGVATMIICQNKAKKLKEEIDQKIQASAIYRQDIQFKNGSSLAVGADMLNDRVMNTRTVGLGLSYNF